MKEKAMLSLAVLVGGALGALCRVEGDSAIMGTMGGLFPLGILCINMAGAFVMGLLMGGIRRLEERHGAWISAFLGTGFLGGFTTFSSFALDTVKLCMQGHLFFSMLNVVLNTLLCVMLAALGWWLSAPSEEDV